MSDTTPPYPIRLLPAASVYCDATQPYAVPNSSTHSRLEDHLIQPSGLAVAQQLLGDRMYLEQSRIDQLNDQLQQRQQLLTDHLDQIDKALMQCNGYLMTLNQVMHPWANPMVEQKQQQLAQIKLNLEAQKRQELNRAWSDQVRLQGDLVEALGQSQSTGRKYRMLWPDPQ